MKPALALVLLAQLAAAPPVGDRLRRATQVDAQVLIRTEHAPVSVDGERYRLVTARAPMVAAVKLERGTRVRLVAYVVRLGTHDEPEEGATPLVVTIGNERHVFPNRPQLVRERVVKTSGELVEIASYPVRYPLATLRGEDEVLVRVALRRPERGGEVGVRLAVESVARQEGAPRNRLVRRKRAPKPPPPPPPPAVEDAGVQVASASDRLEDALDDEPQADAGAAEDAGAIPPPPGPPPPQPTGRVTVVFANQLGEVFDLRAMELAIDGVPVDLPKWRNKRLRDGIAIFDGDIPVGPHFIDLSLMYAGNGGFLFSYMNEYTFHVGDGRRVNVTDGGHVDVRVEAYEGGNFITEMIDRPALRFHLRGSSP